MKNYISMLKEEALNNFRASKVETQENSKYLGLCITFSCDASSAYYEARDFAKKFGFKLSANCGRSFEMVKSK